MIELEFNPKSVWLQSQCSFPLQPLLKVQTKGKSGVYVSYIKGNFYFSVAIRTSLVEGEEIWPRTEVPTPDRVVIYYKCCYFFFFRLSIIYLFRELETGKQPWRFSCYLNSTVRGIVHSVHCNWKPFLPCTNISKAIQPNSLTHESGFSLLPAWKIGAREDRKEDFS